MTKKKVNVKLLLIALIGFILGYMAKDLALDMLLGGSLF